MNERLQRFIDTVTALVDRNAPEAEVLPAARAAMQFLVAQDDWLPEFASRSDPHYYQQYLLYRDPAARFSVVSFVWGPGQKTPVHDHTIWGVIGMLRGSETATPYAAVGNRVTQVRDAVRLQPGDVEMVSPAIGDIHQVANAYEDRVSISIHCYGGDIGATRRHAFDTATGAVKEFVSGYSNA